MESTPYNGLSPEVMQSVMLAALSVAFLLILLIQILYLKNLQGLLKNVREPNRKMAPGMVWLSMIGILNFFLGFPQLMKLNLSSATQTALLIGEYGLTAFNLFWNFYMVNKIAESVTAELASRNMPEPGKPTYAIGMFMCACNTLMLVGRVPSLAYITFVAAGAGFVAWVMYWVKTYEYKKKLAALPPEQQFDF